MKQKGKLNEKVKADEEEPFKVGTVLFSAGDNKSSDVWDDSDLIDHWDRNIEIYRNRYSKQPQVVTEDPPFQQDRRHKVQAGNIKKPVLHKKQRQHGYQSQISNAHATSSKSKEAESSKQKIPIIEQTLSAAMPPMPPMPSNQDDLSNLIMAWYYCGYYTGLYQAQKKPQQSDCGESEKNRFPFSST
ncbi:hypothetical protein BD770DRAFT_388273 [Pilaira anomala]|nr:hypothetical protein BD770DRAFT_388273 [Pilaira anomala]